jgi:hypothetical protein
MSRLSTIKTTTMRLLLAATIVAQLAPMPLQAIAEALTDTDAPALPSSFYGSATLDGATVAEARAAC